MSNLGTPINIPPGAELQPQEIVSRWNEIGVAIERPAFVQFFSSYRESAFRWESFPSYKLAAEEALLRQYAANEPRPDMHFSAWENTLKGATDSGKRFIVTRLVPSDPNSYFDLEVDWSYGPFERAGQISRFILPGEASQEMQIMAKHDFWLFDDSTVVLMQYSPNGEPIGRRLALLADSPREVSYFVNFAGRILGGSIDLTTLHKLGWKRAPRGT